MEFTARQISELLSGTIEGDAEVRVTSLSKIEEGKPGSLSFLANPKYLPFIYTTKASVVIVSKDFVPEQSISPTLIKVEDAYASFARLLEMYNKVLRDKKGIEPHSYIHASAIVGKDAYIGAFVYVGPNSIIGDKVKLYPGVYIGDGVKVGNNTTLFAGAKIYADCVIGNDCTLHAGVIIGADGFGFTPSTGTYNKVAQIGNVVIEDNVEIGAGTTIDRATLGSTI